MTMMTTLMDDDDNNDNDDDGDNDDYFGAHITFLGNGNQFCLNKSTT